MIAAPKKFPQQIREIEEVVGVVAQQVPGHAIWIDSDTVNGRDRVHSFMFRYWTQDGILTDSTGIEHFSMERV